MAPTAIVTAPDAGPGSAAVAAADDMANPSLVVTKDGRIKMEDAPMVDPRPDEVLLHVRATGICGSDIHFWHHGRIGDITVEGDCILGHEGAAEVVAVGANVSHLKAGDRVAIEPGVSCGKCFLCVDGRYNLCQDVAFAGVFPHPGTARRFKTHPASHAHRLPRGVSYQTAALVEPLSVAMHALRTSPVTLGAPAAVFGAGPIGLLTMAVARASGAHPIVITDLDEGRLAFARRFEPRCLTYRIEKGDSPEQSARKIRRLFAAAAREGSECESHGEDQGEDEAVDEYPMPQVVLECTGVESSIATAGYTARRGGTVNVVGVSPRITIDNVPFMHMSLAEIKLLFINRYHDTWPAAIRAIEGGLIDAEKLDMMVTHRFRLEEAVEAMTLVGGKTRPAGGDPVIKVQIVDDKTSPLGG
ncbi:L-iditol 2-dehydrogenase [Purpureocillium takamizusanense]|uniref:L-arabinitol 4-dehydrogenase n=1 Tax=Purpureocillium takamizusanense TaxID=2060973 RepID=A0A9Q8QMN9_9HYPO|nr:L-iditol 2-dehydrogenase [Purpureocillium takamizusanense]UNI22903.1 L-iditol 2-dehydrogenase [Purpureocillium takamizusanense]